MSFVAASFFGFSGGDTRPISGLVSEGCLSLDSEVGTDKAGCIRTGACRLPWLGPGVFFTLRYSRQVERESEGAHS